MSKLSQLGVTGRIILGFSVVLALLVLVGTIASLNTRRMAAGYGTYRELATDTSVASKFDSQFLNLRLAVVDYLQGLVKREKVEAEVQKTERQVVAVKKAIGDPESVRIVGEMEDYVVRFMTVLGEIKTVEDATQDRRDAMMRNGEEIAKRAAKLAESLNVDRAQLGDELVASASATLFWVIALSLGALATGVAASMFISRSISVPLKALLAALQDAARGEGDLTKRLPVTSSDEIGQMAGSFNEFVAKIQEVISETKSESATLSEQANSLNSAASQLTSAADSTRTSTAQMVTNASEMATGMQNVHQLVDGMTEGVRGAAASVEEMSASISEVEGSTRQSLEVANQANQLASDSSDRMAELNSAADEIGRVVSTIQEIAEQTNLLALNATIEAARAGEAGKGFAVVADEIKELARQTSDSTGDIRSRIEHIQGTTTTAVEAIARITDVITTMHGQSQMIAGAVAEQRTSTEAIARELSTTSGSAEQVARHVETSAKLSQSIQSDLGNLETIATTTAQQAEASTKTGESLSRVASAIDRLVSTYRVS